MVFQLPPIVQAAQTLQQELELAVIRMPRLHKYQHGQVLRAGATRIRRIAYQAWNFREERPRLLDDLVVAIDNFKLDLQLGKDLQAFKSFAEFEQIWRTLLKVGEQAGAWRRSIKHPEGQRAAA